MTIFYTLIIVLCIFGQPCQVIQGVPVTLDICKAGGEAVKDFIDFKMQETDIPYAVQIRCKKFEGENA